jgi:hypothetical protein
MIICDKTITNVLAYDRLGGEAGLGPVELGDRYAIRGAHQRLEPARFLPLARRGEPSGDSGDLNRHRRASGRVSASKSIMK